MTENTEPYTPTTSPYQAFLDYRAIIICAIAKAWKDEVFKEELLANPKHALSVHFGYRFPYDMDLTVNANSAEYRPDLVNDWRAIEFASITLMLPPAPKDESERALALAEYNLRHLTFLQKRHTPTFDDIVKIVKEWDHRKKIENTLKGV